MARTHCLVSQYGNDSCTFGDFQRLTTTKETQIFDTLILRKITKNDRKIQLDSNILAYNGFQVITKRVFSICQIDIDTDQKERAEQQDALVIAHKRFNYAG